MPGFMLVFARYNLLLAGGALATFALFFLMQMLINVEYAQPDKNNTIRIADITAPDLIIDVVKKQPLPEKPQDPVVPPKIELPVTGSIAGNGPTLPMVTPQYEPTAPGPVEGWGVSNAEAIALIQVQPVYPPRALQRAVEGYVIVEFDVDESGLVINPRVLYAEPEGYFETASLKALERYRYQPKIVNGRAVKMFGVQQKLSYNLE